MKSIKDFLGQLSHNRNTKSVVFGENKVIFVTGGPGSGKDVIIREVLSHSDITEVNHLQAFNYLTDKKKLNEKSHDFRRETIRNHYPLIINAPADDADKIAYIKEELETLGYNSLMVFVNTSDEVSKERNEKLARMMYESVRHSRWSASQQNKKQFKNIFENFLQIDNNETMDQIEEDIEIIYKKINKFLVSESSKPKVVDLDPKLKADGPDDITPDNRGDEPQTDDIKYDAGKRRKSYIFKTYSEDSDVKMVVKPEPKGTNFSKDKESAKKKKMVDSPTVNQRMRNVDGIGQEFDTRQQGTVYPMSGLGNVTYREQREFKSFRSKLKEAIDDPGAVDMGVGGVLNGATNKEPMQSYKDQDKKIGIKITKKGKKNV